MCSVMLRLCMWLCVMSHGGCACAWSSGLCSRLDQDDFKRVVKQGLVVLSEVGAGGRGYMVGTLSGLQLCFKHCYVLDAARQHALGLCARPLKLLFTAAEAVTCRMHCVPVSICQRMCLLFNHVQGVPSLSGFLVGFLVGMKVF